MAQAQGRLAPGAQLQHWLGSSLQVATAAADRGHVAALPAEERSAVRCAVPARQAEFATARVLARLLLAELGSPLPALSRQLDRAPAWPAEVEASITHTEGRCLVVARRRIALGLGVDWERESSLPRAHWDAVLTPDEQRSLHARVDAEAAAMQIFSVKEALFKAMHRCGNDGLDFLAIEVGLPVSDGDECTLKPLADFARRLPEGARPRAWSMRLPEGGVLSAAEVRA